MPDKVCCLRGGRATSIPAQRQRCSLRSQFLSSLMLLKLKLNSSKSLETILLSTKRHQKIDGVGRFSGLITHEPKHRQVPVHSPNDVFCLEGFLKLATDVAKASNDRWHSYELPLKPCHSCHSRSDRLTTAISLLRGKEKKSRSLVCISLTSLWQTTCGNENKMVFKR